MQNTDQTDAKYAPQSGKYKFEKQTLREYIHRIENMNMMLRAAFGLMSFIQDALIIVQAMNKIVEQSISVKY